MGQRDLPLASGDAHVRAFERAGWVCIRRKAHFILTKEGSDVHLSIPAHREVKRALLQKQIRLAGLTEREYLVLFGR